MELMLMPSPLPTDDRVALAPVLEQHLSDPGGYVVELYLSSLRSQQSRRSMRSSLRAVCQLVLCETLEEADPASVGPGRIDWAALDWGSASRLKTLMRTRWATATVNRHLAAVRGVVKVSQLVGLMGADRAARCREALKSERAQFAGPDARDRLVTDAELRSCFAVLAGDEKVSARRDAAMVAVLAMGGLRRSEAVALDLTDWRPEPGELIVRHGKGGKVRKVWLHAGAVVALDDWLTVRGAEPGPLLARVGKSGVVVAGEPGRLSDHAVWKRLVRLCERAQVAGFAPHDLRRKVITDLLDCGVDLSAAQQLAGHSTIATTARYDRRGERAARAASTRLSVPYIRPGAPL